MLFGRLLSLLEGTLPAQVIGSEGPALAPIWRLTDIYVRLASLESRRTSFIRFVLEDLRPHAGLSTYCEFTSLGGKSSTANDRVKHPCHDARMMFAYEDGRIIIWRTQTDPRHGWPYVVTETGSAETNFTTSDEAFGRTKWLGSLTIDTTHEAV